MTQPLNFTSPAPAPVGCLLDCAKDSDAANNLKLARAIDVELDGRGSEQHVKIKVGTLRTLVNSIQSLDKLSASLEAALDERRGELIEVRDGLIEWRTYAMRLLANSFMTYPTSEAVDDNLRIMITASIEHEQRKLKVVSKERDELRNTANAADQLRKAAELERDDVIHLNRNAAEEIQHLTKTNDNLRHTISRMETVESELKQQRSVLAAKVNTQEHEIANLKKRNEHLDEGVVELVRQRDKNGQHANQLANELNEKRKEISRLLEIINRLHAEIAEKRDIIGAATQRISALTNDAKALNEQNSEMATRLANAGLEIASYKLLVEDLKAGTAVDRDQVKRLEETVQRQYGQLNEWYDWASDLICSPSQLGREGLRTAITRAMKKRKERTEHLEAALNSVTAQRDAWVIWAREFADAPAGLHTTEQLIAMVQEKVKGSRHTTQGTLKVTKLKEDVLLTSRGWCKMQDGNVTIQNAVIASGSIPASKVKFSEAMEDAIRELIQKELSPINGAIADILSKMRK